MKNNPAKNSGALQDTDLRDTKKDNIKLQQDKSVIDLPDVEDIPGQENIKPPSLKMFNDTTISSADEEGEKIWGNTGDDADISAEEMQLLEDPLESDANEEDLDLKKASLDNKDEDGELLNEESFGDDRSGKDLDVPGTEEDDADEEKGDEDEENNYYSLGGDDKEG